MTRASMPQNNKMQQRHGSYGASLLILVLDGRRWIMESRGRS